MAHVEENHPKRYSAENYAKRKMKWEMIFTPTPKYYYITAKKYVLFTKKKSKRREIGYTTQTN